MVAEERANFFFFEFSVNIFDVLKFRERKIIEIIGNERHLALWKRISFGKRMDAERSWLNSIVTHEFSLESVKL